MIGLFNFIEDCFLRAKLNGTKVTRENAIDDFITIYGIDMSWRETFWTYVKREKKNMTKEIENRRNEAAKQLELIISKKEEADSNCKDITFFVVHFN